MKSTSKVLCLLSCVTLIQGQFGWFDFEDKLDKFDKRSCTTEYDDVHSEKCDTKYHLSCVKATETVCRPTQVRLCNPEPIESCHFVKEDKCMSVPIPSCDVTWHKVCKDRLVCSKTFEVTVPDIPPPVYKEPVPTGAPEVPVGPVINNPDVSAEVTPQEENVDEIINADEIIEPDDEIEGPMINRRKRSLTPMVKAAAVGAAVLKKKLKLKKLAKIETAGIAAAAAAISGGIPGLPFPDALSMIPGVSVDPVSTEGSEGSEGPINNRRRRSLDEDDEVPIPAGYSMPYESEEDHGERHKRATSAAVGAAVLKKLKLKKLAKKGIAAAGISGAMGPQNSNLGLLQSMRQRRSLDEDDEVEETEEYEDLEEIETLPIPAGYSMPYESEEDHGERHKRATAAAVGAAVLKKLKLKKLKKLAKKGIAAAAISGAMPGLSVGPQNINLGLLQSMRQRRSLDEDDEVEETEEYEDLDEIYDLEEIETLPIPAGYSMPDESEEDHGERHKRGLPDFSSWNRKPVKNCVTQKKCTNVPKRDCGIQKKETCIPFPKKKCETKYIEKCYTVTRQECGEAVNKKCTSIPTKDCKKVIERRPRLVCPPPPTVERIQEPVFTKEVPIEGSGVPVGPIINN